MPTATSNEQPLDPTCPFAVGYLTRAEIVSLLNGLIVEHSWDMEMYVPSDPRLTDNVCQAIAYAHFTSLDESLDTAIFPDVQEQTFQEVLTDLSLWNTHHE